MNKHVYWAWAVENIINIICWTVLAIFFARWWIALFAILTGSILKMNNQTESEGQHENHA